MNPLEALARLADDLAATEQEEGEAVDYIGPRGLWADVEPEVRRILAALSPRVVTTAEELDTLPPGAVVVTADGSAWQQGDGDPLSPGYWQPAEADTWPEDARETVRRMSLPATVVWTPQQDPNPTPPGH